MNIPENLKYTNDHEWLKIDGNIGYIGITDYAQGELGDIVYIDIPEDLSEVKKGESCGTIEAVKTVSEILAPVSGKVLEVNRKLNDAPDTINKDPYNEGWLLKIELSNPAEANDLLDAKAYAALIG
ncbi:MAG TPA: glycine cleavage system protein GcvH [Candidatus Kapabacteria bacterium]|jgi:glycine cleavage system H protein|nr:glycine cleavage system protein GcvH [Candidatus Kapabacteria bacterium]HOV93094.1 glycine cleavage system protein GcvH [Candidatus Kapabacteria bacterium]